MSNFDPSDRDRLIRTGMLGRCETTGTEFSVGPVKVVARYTDCSVFVCPECERTHDDRPAWGGPRERRMGYSVVTKDDPRRRWETPWT